MIFCLTRGETCPRPMIDASSAAISTSVRFVGLRDRRYSRITCIPSNRNQFPMSDGWHNCVRVVRSSSPQKYDPYVQSAFGAPAESDRFRILWDSITVSVARGPRDNKTTLYKQ